MKNEKHANISIFIPHNGCTHRCSFCNQNTITGQSVQPRFSDVVKILEKARVDLKGRAKSSEIAFFGGSFTAVKRDYMTELLKAGYEFVKDGSFSGIRISTRPDAIDAEVLEFLKKYKVMAIELGCQSMDNEVLSANRRGHTEQDVINACRLIKKYGFSLGLQMMTGLYKSTIERDKQTAEKIILLKPDTVRIYPTVVMKNTYLEKLYNSGEYAVYSLDDTVKLCAYLLDRFGENNIPVIKLGLHYSEDLEKNKIAGAYHPALRELCESRSMLRKVLSILEAKKTEGKNNINVCIYVRPEKLSKMIGQKKSNIEKLRQCGYNVRVKADNTLGQNDIRVEQLL